MAAKPTTIDEYLAGLSDNKRTALEKVRQAIKAAAPRAEECISYQLPAFRLDGRLLVGFGAAAKHCALYGAMPVEAFEKELAAYDTSKGTIRFTPDRPIPATVVRKLIKARIAERAAAAAARRAPVRSTRPRSTTTAGKARPTKKRPAARRNPHAR